MVARHTITKAVKARNHGGARPARLVQSEGDVAGPWTPCHLSHQTPTVGETV